MFKFQNTLLGGRVGQLIIFYCVTADFVPFFDRLKDGMDLSQMD
jgi:hypothetical protein